MDRQYASIDTTRLEPITSPFTTPKHPENEPNEHLVKTHNITNNNNFRRFMTEKFN